MLRKRVDYSASRVERNIFELQWLKNVAFFSGKHQLFIRDGVLTTAVPEDIPEHKVFYKVNLCSAALMRACAKVLGINATMKAIPMSDSIRHKGIAETSERLFDHVKDINDWNGTVQLRGTMWAGLCGSGFYKTFWDQLGGRPQRFYMAQPGSREVVPTPMLSNDERQRRDQAGVYRDLSEGETQIAVMSPFAVFHDWTSRDRGVLGCRWMADSHYLDKEVVAEIHGIDPDDLGNDDQNAGLTRYEEAIAFMSSYDWATPFAWSDTQDKHGKRCRYVDYYERPSRAYKNGRRICYGGGRILLDGPNPYAGDLSAYSHLPYIKQDWCPHPGRFWGRSLVEDLTNPNYYINETRSAILELVRIFGRPRTYIWSDSGLNKDEMTRDAGGVYTINRMSKKPEHDPAVTISPEVANIGMTCQADLNMLASQSTAEEGAMPAQLRSGEAVRNMIESRDIGLSIPGKCSIIAARDVGRAALGICKLFYVGPRVLRYIGTDSQWNFRNFQGADINNDLVIIGDPSITSTEAARKADIYDAIDSQALSPQTNPVDRQIVLSALHYADSDTAIKKALRAMKHQETEIQDMIANPQAFLEQPYPVMPYDDHQAEADVLVTFFYSQQFLDLDPETKSVLVSHWELHATALAEMQAQQMQMQEAAKGSPGQKGQPSKAKG